MVQVFEADPAQIASEALDILREEDAASKPFYMSKLGNRLSTRLGHPLRNLLGPERLSTLLSRQLGDMLRFEGQGATLAVRINEGQSAKKQSLRYDPAVWAAFSKPLGEGHRRYLSAERPFSFIDEADPFTTLPGFEIERDRIPEPGLSKPERESIIKKQIDDWCRANSIPASTLLLVQDEKIKVSKKTDDYDYNVKLIVNLIEAIPPDERSSFSLPLNLIYRILKK